MTNCPADVSKTACRVLGSSCGVNTNSKSVSSRFMACRFYFKCRIRGRTEVNIMNLSDYAAYDAVGLAELVATKQVTPRELAETAARAIESVNPSINAVVETYPDRIESLDEKTLGDGPFRGVPFLIKDVFGHEAGRKI